MDTTTAFCVKLQKIVGVWVCVGVCGCAKRKTERQTTFSWRKVLPIFVAGGVWTCSNIENDHVTTNKGKAVPLQAWSGLEVSRKLKFPDFMTTAHDGGKFASLTHRPPLPPGNTPGIYFC
jgi:hypothetical protein